VKKLYFWAPEAASTGYRWIGTFFVVFSIIGAVICVVGLVTSLI